MIILAKKDSSPVKRGMGRSFANLSRSPDPSPMNEEYERQDSKAPRRHNAEATNELAIETQSAQSMPLTAIALCALCLWPLLYSSLHPGVFASLRLGVCISLRQPNPPPQPSNSFHRNAKEQVPLAMDLQKV